MNRGRGRGILSQIDNSTTKQVGPDIEKEKKDCNKKINDSKKAFDENKRNPNIKYRSPPGKTFIELEKETSPTEMERRKENRIWDWIETVKAQQPEPERTKPNNLPPLLLQLLRGDVREQQEQQQSLQQESQPDKKQQQHQQQQRTQSKQQEEQQERRNTRLHHKQNQQHQGNQQYQYSSQTAQRNQTLLNETRTSPQKQYKTKKSYDTYESPLGFIKKQPQRYHETNNRYKWVNPHLKKLNQNDNSRNSPSSVRNPNHCNVKREKASCMPNKPMPESNSLEKKSKDPVEENRVEMDEEEVWSFEEDRKTPSRSDGDETPENDSVEDELRDGRLLCTQTEQNCKRGTSQEALAESSKHKQIESTHIQNDIKKDKTVRSEKEIVKKNSRIDETGTDNVEQINVCETERKEEITCITRTKASSSQNLAEENEVRTKDLEMEEDLDENKQDGVDSGIGTDGVQEEMKDCGQETEQGKNDNKDDNKECENELSPNKSERKANENKDGGERTNEKNKDDREEVNEIKENKRQKTNENKNETDGKEDSEGEAEENKGSVNGANKSVDNDEVEINERIGFEKEACRVKDNTVLAEKNKDVASNSHINRNRRTSLDKNRIIEAETKGFKESKLKCEEKKCDDKKSKIITKKPDPFLRKSCVENYKEGRSNKNKFKNTRLRCYATSDSEEDKKSDECKGTNYDESRGDSEEYYTTSYYTTDDEESEHTSYSDESRPYANEEYESEDSWTTDDSDYSEESDGETNSKDVCVKLNQRTNMLLSNRYKNNEKVDIEKQKTTERFHNNGENAEQFARKCNTDVLKSEVNFEKLRPRDKCQKGMTLIKETEENAINRKQTPRNVATSEKDTRGKLNERLYRETCHDKHSRSTATTKAAKISRLVTLYNWKTNRVDVIGRGPKWANAKRKKLEANNHTEEAFPELQPSTPVVSKRKSLWVKPKNGHGTASYSKVASKHRPPIPSTRLVSPTNSTSDKRKLTSTVYGTINSTENKRKSPKTSKASKLKTTPIPKVKKHSSKTSSITKTSPLKTFKKQPIFESVNTQEEEEEEIAYSFEEIAAKVRKERLPEILTSTADCDVLRTDMHKRKKTEKEDSFDCLDKDDTSISYNGDIDDNNGLRDTNSYDNINVMCEDGKDADKQCSYASSYVILENDDVIEYEMIGNEEVEENDESFPTEEQLNAIIHSVGLCDDFHEDEKFFNRQKQSRHTIKPFDKHLTEDPLLAYISSFESPSMFISEMKGENHGLFKTHWTPAKNDVRFWCYWHCAEENDLDFPILNTVKTPPSLLQPSSCKFEDCLFNNSGTTIHLQETC